MTTSTQTTLLTRGNFGAIGLFLIKILCTPILASAMLIAPYAFVAGWLPTNAQMPYKLLSLLGDDFKVAGAAFVSEAHDPNEQTQFDRRGLWRVQLNSEVVARLIANRDLRSVDAQMVPDYFWNQFPLWWPHQASVGARFHRTAGWEPNARGEDDFNFLMMYDEAEGVAYFWVKDNF